MGQIVCESNAECGDGSYCAANKSGCLACPAGQYADSGGLGNSCHADSCSGNCNKLDAHGHCVPTIAPACPSGQHRDSPCGDCHQDNCDDCHPLTPDGHCGAGCPSGYHCGAGHVCHEDDCPSGQHRDAPGGNCHTDSCSGCQTLTSDGHCQGSVMLSACPSGQHRDTPCGSCHQDNCDDCHGWTPDGHCGSGCPSGTHCAGHSICVDDTCPSGQHRDATGGVCHADACSGCQTLTPDGHCLGSATASPCPGGQHRDTPCGTCYASTCGPDYILDANGYCVPKPAGATPTTTPGNSTVSPTYSITPVVRTAGTVNNLITAFAAPKEKYVQDMCAGLSGKALQMCRNEATADYNDSRQQSGASIAPSFVTLNPLSLKNVSGTPFVINQQNITKDSSITLDPMIQYGVNSNKGYLTTDEYNKLVQTQASMLDKIGYTQYINDYNNYQQKLQSAENMNPNKAAALYNSLEPERQRLAAQSDVINKALTTSGVMDLTKKLDQYQQSNVGMSAATGKGAITKSFFVDQSLPQYRQDQIAKQMLSQVQTVYNDTNPYKEAEKLGLKSVQQKDLPWYAQGVGLVWGAGDAVIGAGNTLKGAVAGVGGNSNNWLISDAVNFVPNLVSGLGMATKGLGNLEAVAATQPTKIIPTIGASLSLGLLGEESKPGQGTKAASYLGGFDTGHNGGLLTDIANDPARFGYNMVLGEAYTGGAGAAARSVSTFRNALDEGSSLGSAFRAAGDTGLGGVTKGLGGFKPSEPKVVQDLFGRLKGETGGAKRLGSDESLPGKIESRLFGRDTTPDMYTPSGNGVRRITTPRESISEAAQRVASTEATPGQRVRDAIQDRATQLVRDTFKPTNVGRNFLLAGLSDAGRNAPSWNSANTRTITPTDVSVPTYTRPSNRTAPDDLSYWSQTPPPQQDDQQWDNWSGTNMFDFTLTKNANASVASQQIPVRNDTQQYYSSSPTSILPFSDATINVLNKSATATPVLPFPETQRGRVGGGKNYSFNTEEYNPLSSDFAMPDIGGSLFGKRRY